MGSVLGDHFRRGKTLTPPLADHPIQLLDWVGVFLPENLWLAYLLDRYEILKAVVHYDALCDAIDKDWKSEPDVFLGYASDFKVVTQDGRAVLQTLLTGTLSASMGEDFRNALLLYSDGPAVWLAAAGNATVTAAFELVRRLVIGLRDSHSSLASECRLLALRRMLARGRVHFPPGIPDEELMERLTSYPNVDEEAARHVQQFGRVTMNAFIGLSDRDFGPWGRHFWETNFNLIKCA